MHRVDAQQARRVLDRLVGYTLSPLLMQEEPLGTGESAGRVQSVAVRLVVDRERRSRPSFPGILDVWRPAVDRAEGRDRSSAKLVRKAGEKVELPMRR